MIRRFITKSCVLSRDDVEHSNITAIGVYYEQGHHVCVKEPFCYQCIRNSTKSELDKCVSTVLSDIILDYAKTFRGINIAKTRLHNVNQISCIVSFPDGKLAIGSCDHTIQLWNMNTSTKYKNIQKGRVHCVSYLQLKGHTGEILSMVVLPNEDLVSASRDQHIRVWNSKNGECKQLMKGDSGPVWSLQVLHNGSIASGSNSHIIKVWNTETGECIQELNTQESALHTAISPNGHLLYTGMCYVSMCNMHTGEYKTIISQARRYGRILCMVVLTNGDVATGRDQGTIQIWNVHTGECKTNMKGHTNCVSSMAVLPNGDLVSSADDHTVRVWDIESGYCKHILETCDWEEWMTVLPNGDLATASYSSVKIWT